MVSEEVFNFECFLTNKGIYKYTSIYIYIYIASLEIKYVFLKMSLMAMLPPLLILVALIGIGIKVLISRSSKNFRNHFIATGLILLFIVHPFVSAYTFSLFRYDIIFINLVVIRLIILFTIW